jgi:hypothetical protein
MRPYSKPSKQQVREWLRELIASNEPPPSPDRVREQLGWWLLRPRILS